MKSVLIIGLGKFGHHLTRELANQGNEIMIVDEKEESISDLLDCVTSSVIGDCTNPEVLESLGIDNFDICFVCIGNNFQSSLEITSLIKEMGANYVVSKANRDIHAKFLLRNGADEVIYPDRDVAVKTAVRFSANNVFDYIDLGSQYAIYETPVPKKWAGKTIRQLNIRQQYQVSILGIKDGEKTSVNPMPELQLKEGEHMLLVGTREVIEKLLKTIG